MQGTMTAKTVNDCFSHGMSTRIRKLIGYQFVNGYTCIQLIVCAEDAADKYLLIPAICMHTYIQAGSKGLPFLVWKFAYTFETMMWQEMIKAVYKLEIRWPSQTEVENSFQTTCIVFSYHRNSHYDQKHTTLKTHFTCGKAEKVHFLLHPRILQYSYLISVLKMHLYRRFYCQQSGTWSDYYEGSSMFRYTCTSMWTFEQKPWQRGSS